jgi:hypothetical protein
MGIFNRNKLAENDYTGIIKEFKKQKYGEPLPREGACTFFYNYFAYAGETISLKYKNEYVIFHIETDDIIQEILAGTPTVHIVTDMERKIISLLFKTGEIINRIQLTIDVNNRESLQLLMFLKKKKKIEINLLNLVYGEIVKEKTLAIPISKETLEDIKKAAG